MPIWNEILSLEIFGLTYRQVLLALLILLATILLRNVIAHILFAGIRLWTSRTKATWDDLLLDALYKPASAIIFTLGGYMAIQALEPSAAFSHAVFLALKSLITIFIFWALIKGLNVLSNIFKSHDRYKGLSMATFIPLFKQILVIVLIMICLVMVLDILGFSVASIIAALGIGGAAIAFASQNTIANLYGSISIALDHPFRVGDFIKMANVMGTVEAIGLRSTQIRTLDNTLVSVPNNTVAAESIENFSKITQRRVRTYIGLVYSTTPAQIEAITRDIRAAMAELGDKLLPTPQAANFMEFADSSLNIEITCFINTSDYQRALEIKEEFFLKIMKLVEKNGSSFAFPSRTVYLAKES